MYKDFEVINNRTGLTITKYNGHSADVEIPRDINGVPVTALGEGAFTGNEELVHVSIPNTVTLIDSSCFGVCINLESVTMADSVTTINEFAFIDCPKLVFVAFSKGITAIPKGLFCSCDSLYSIKLPKRITTIGESAFEDCKLLDSTAFDECVSDIRSIDKHAFINCPNIDKNIFKDVSDIHPNAFEKEVA